MVSEKKPTLKFLSNKEMSLISLEYVKLSKKIYIHDLLDVLKQSKRELTRVRYKIFG